ncbi:hypothetical protein [Geminicoccus flavidas]|uniref:hypothetical protein n=1 Tax=Geminicoccus flavidas TaxID=2506407 RepID=UPI00135B716E|nr:hypothetical protein [Geminicoccus flavidas]
MTIHHHSVKVMPGITFCGCLICQADRLPAVARVAAKMPKHASKLARTFAELTEKVAIASGQIGKASAGTSSVLSGGEQV